MHRSSGYYDSQGGDYEYIEPSRHAEGMQMPASQRHDRRPVPLDTRETYYMPLLSQRGQPSAQLHRYPSNGGILTQPGVSGTAPQSSAPSRHQEVMRGLPSRNMGGVLWRRDWAQHTPLLDHPDGRQSEENRVAEIVEEMEKDDTLMAANPLSEQLRMETVRKMAEPLRIKRTIKSHLVRSVSQNSKRALSIWKMTKYNLSIFFTKLALAIKNLLYTLELWYSSLKTIEGHFGSGVVTYFKFLRWLFILNTTVFLISFGLIVIPQLLYRSHEPVKGNQSSVGHPTVFIPSYQDGFFPLVEQNNSTVYWITPVPVTPADSKVAASRDSERQVSTDSYASNVDFSFGDIFTGEGSFTDTSLYHSYYTNESISTVSGLTYHMPPAYFFTVLACYLFIFIFLSVSMARSYRRTVIETAGDMDVFSHKVFCGWDFSIATRKAAELKSNSIYNELQELLGDMMKDDTKLTCENKCCLWNIRIALNVFVGLLVAGSGTLIWFLLHWEVGIDDSTACAQGTTMVVPIIVTIIMMVAPILFSWMTRLEGYASPRTALFVTLTKTFLMEAVVIGIIVGFWITFRHTCECWETSVGQEVYRLVIIDFLFTIVGTSLAEFCRFQIYKRMWKGIGIPEFDIARGTLNIIYNQTLFIVGFYFSPLLALVVVLKMFITFYIRKHGLLHSCQPSIRPWRAAQTQTLFLVLSFVASLMALILLGYIVTQVESSTCGPFRHYDYPYGVILDVFQVTSDTNGFILFIRFITKPGVIGGVLLAMCVGVYYLRAESLAYKRLVDHLRKIVALEVKDKEFLLNKIARVIESRPNVSTAHNYPPVPERQRFHPGMHRRRY